MIAPMIGHYKVKDKLGEGGMGEVYLATDTKLGRDVAIKVLSRAFSGDVRRMARFAREAKVLAALNHPNIAAIYSLEENALVMELVTGPTLAERIAQGPMPAAEALPIARQIAEALEYAHKQGIIHRDLKPSNIKLAGPASESPGRVKVLDFGLAKLRERGEKGSAASTQTMAIVGSPGYVSPEQLEGKPADERSDIFAFGCVLYEMLSGRRAFHGETMAASLAATAIAEPRAIRRAPKELEKLALRCLRKDPAHRIQSMGDVRLALEELKRGSEAGGAYPEKAHAARFRLGWIAAGVLGLGAISATVMHFRERTPSVQKVPVAPVVQQPAPPPKPPEIAPAAKATRQPRKDATSSKEAILAEADAARDRLREKMQQVASPAPEGAPPAKAGPAVDPKDAVDLATIGAKDMLTGPTNYEDWSARVMKDVGDLVNWIAAQSGKSPEEVLRQVYSVAQAVVAKLQPAAKGQ
jgi:predicted Ser/Thr protein kinase